MSTAANVRTETRPVKTEGNTKPNAPYLRSPEAARYIACSVQTMKQWRHENRGPAYSKVGRSVVYERAELDEFMRAHRVKPEKP